MESLALSIRLERRWPLWCVLALALAWLAAAGFDVAARSPGNIAAIALAVLPPIGLAALVAALLPGAGKAMEIGVVEDRLAEASRTVGDLQARLADVDALLEATSSRTEQLASVASAGAGGLAASAEALEAAAAKIIAGGEEAQRFTEHFRETLPEIARTVRTVDTTLRAASTDSATQLRAVETMLAAVQTRNREAAVQADAAIANMTALLARIDEASTRNTAALSKRAYALDAAVDGVLERTTSTVDHIRESVEARLEALQGGVEAAGKQMAFLGDDGIRLFNQRLEQLLRTSEAMKAALFEHEADSARLQAQMDAQLQALQARIGEVSGAGIAMTDTLRDATTANFTQIGAQLAEVRDNGMRVIDEIDVRASGIDATLREAANTRATELEQRFVDVSTSGTMAVDEIGDRIAAMDAAVREAVAARRATFEAEIKAMRESGTAAVDDIGSRMSGIDETLRAAALARAGELEQRFAEIEASGRAAVDEIGQHIAAMDAAVREAATERLTAFRAQVDEVRIAGSAAVEDVGLRVVGVEETLRTAAMARTAELEQRFADIGAAGAVAAGDIGNHVTAIEASLAALAAPLSDSQVALAALDGQSATLRQTVADVEAALTDKIAATRSAVQALEDEAKAMIGTVASLRDSVAEGSQLVGEAAAGLADERGEVLRVSSQLEGHFEAAQAALAAIRSGAAEAATEAAAALDGELARLQAATGAAAGTMRVVLASVIDDSVTALQTAAASHAEAAFSEPIKAQLLAIEEAATRAGNAGRTVTEQLATNMFKLAKTLAIVDARAGEIDTRFVIRERDSLAVRASRLVGQLNDSLIDVTRLLAIKIGDAEWAQYLKGDRSVFAYAMASQLDREASRRIARMVQHDPAFREEAARYLDTFEALIQRLLGDRDGEAFAATMLSSDMGKIYVAISEASDRLPPSRSIS